MTQRHMDSGPGDAAQHTAGGAGAPGAGDQAVPG
jgi:hypothetical protein